RLDLEALKRIGDYVGKPVRFETLEQGREFIRGISATVGAHSEEQWNQLTDTVLVKKDGYYTTHYDPAIGDSFKDLTSVTVDMHEKALWEAYDHIQAETLVVRGEHSDLLSAHTAQEMSERGPKAKVATIQAVGHAPTFMTDPQIEVVRAFLD
ncbi:MAG: alpha/beta hydrolase, partial [Limnobacter sp.]|nr:alpha/beta hydrolase [Limnobacter sp.]